MATLVPLSEILADEMAAREWDEADVAARMGGDDLGLNLLTLQVLLSVDSPTLLLDSRLAAQLSAAFDVSPEFFLNINAMYRQAHGFGPRKMTAGDLGLED